MKNEKEQKTLGSLLGIRAFDAAVFVALITAILYVASAAWWSGYLSYFGVQISMINFSPSILDFATRGLSAIILILIVSVFYILIIFIIKCFFDRLQEQASKSKQKFWQSFAQDKNGPIIGDALFRVMAGIIVLLVSYHACFIIFPGIGRDNAKKRAELFHN